MLGFCAFWLHQDGIDSGDTTSLSLSSDPWGHNHIIHLLNKLKAREDWATCCIINKAFMKYKAKMKNKRLEEKTQQPSSQRETIVGVSTIGQTSPSTMSELSNISFTLSSKIGQPLGST